MSKKLLYSLAVIGLLSSCGNLKSDERNRNYQNPQDMDRYEDGYYRTPQAYQGMYFDENQSNGNSGYYQGTKPYNIPGAHDPENQYNQPPAPNHGMYQGSGGYNTSNNGNQSQNNLPTEKRFGAKNPLNQSQTGNQKRPYYGNDTIPPAKTGYHAGVPKARKINNASPKFDAQTVNTFKGEVIRVIRKDSPFGTVHLIKVVLLTEGGQEVVVDLGPANYIDETQMNLQRGDQLEVKGSQVISEEGNPMIIAQEINKGSYHLVLRDKTGKPLWTDEGKNL